MSAAIRFISAEPLLGPLPDLNLEGISWVICGGESGPGARPMHPDWVRSIRDQCVAAAVPFLLKQWGEWAPERLVGVQDFPWGVLDIEGNFFPQTSAWNGKTGADSETRETYMWRVGKKAAGRLLDGKVWDQKPEEWK